MLCAFFVAWHTQNTTGVGVLNHAPTSKASGSELWSVPVLLKAVRCTQLKGRAKYHLQWAWFCMPRFTIQVISTVPDLPGIVHPCTGGGRRKLVSGKVDVGEGSIWRNCAHETFFSCSGGGKGFGVVQLRSKTVRVWPCDPPTRICHVLPLPLSTFWRCSSPEN